MPDLTEYRKQTTLKYMNKYNELRPRLPVYIQEYLSAKRINCQMSSVAAYAEDLLMFLEYLKESNPMLKDVETSKIPEEFLDNLNYSDINDYQAYLRGGIRSDGHIFQNEPATLARHMSSVRAFFKYEYAHGLLKSDPTAGAESVKLKKDKVIDRLSGNEVDRLMDVISNSSVADDHQRAYVQKTQYRDTAILTLLLNTGIRVSECVGLNLEDIDFDEMTISIIRKGGKPDKVYFNDDVAAALSDYIELERPNYLPDKGEKALFLSNRKSRMKVRSIQEMVKKYADIALPLHRKVTPHKMRKTYGTALYEETGDIKMVADVLGHDSVQTTAQNYIANTNNKKEAGRKRLFGQT